MSVKVFIVEDEPMIIEVLKAYLEKFNYEVESSQNGREGLRRIKETNTQNIRYTHYVSANNAHLHPIITV